MSILLSTAWCWEHVDVPVFFCGPCRLFWSYCCEGRHVCPPEVLEAKGAELKVDLAAAELQAEGYWEIDHEAERAELERQKLQVKKGGRRAGRPPQGESEQLVEADNPTESGELRDQVADHFEGEREAEAPDLPGPLFGSMAAEGLKRQGT